MSKRDDDAALVLATARKDLSGNVRFFGLVFVGVVLLGQWLRFVAVIGIVAFGFLLLWSSVRSFIALGLGLYLAVAGTSSTASDTEVKFWTAKAFLLVETLAYGVFVTVLYWMFFHTS